MNDANAGLAQIQYHPFSFESGLYSGFGTAWYRNYALNLEEVLGIYMIDLHCDYFDSSMTQKEELTLPLFQPELQVSVGYRNSF